MLKNIKQNQNLLRHFPSLLKTNKNIDMDIIQSNQY